MLTLEKRRSPKLLSLRQNSSPDNVKPEDTCILTETVQDLRKTFTLDSFPKPERSDILRQTFVVENGSFTARTPDSGSCNLPVILENVATVESKENATLASSKRMREKTSPDSVKSKSRRYIVASFSRHLKDQRKKHQEKEKDCKTTPTAEISQHQKPKSESSKSVLKNKSIISVKTKKPSDAALPRIDSHNFNSNNNKEYHQKLYNIAKTGVNSQKLTAIKDSCRACSKNHSDTDDQLSVKSRTISKVKLNMACQKSDTMLDNNNQSPSIMTDSKRKYSKTKYETKPVSEKRKVTFAVSPTNVDKPKLPILESSKSDVVSIKSKSKLPLITPKSAVTKSEPINGFQNKGERTQQMAKSVKLAKCGIKPLLSSNNCASTSKEQCLDTTKDVKHCSEQPNDKEHVSVNCKLQLSSKHSQELQLKDKQCKGLPFPTRALKAPRNIVKVQH